MATDPRKRQEKPERRAANPKEWNPLPAKGQPAALGQRLTAAATSPPLHSSVTEDLWAQGLGWVLFSRGLPDGSVAVAVFLVGRYCLGVKNALADIVSRSSYESNFARKLRSEFASRDVSPSAARKLVEGAVEYARGLGFPPHPAYDTANLLFGDVDAGGCADEFEFGKDGQPFFIAGPHDTPDRCRQILGLLTRSRGPGGFHYLVRAGDPDVLPDALKKGQVRVIGEDENGDILDAMIDFDDKA